ncbi:hypothetical protein PYCCODRAFT_1330794, partial [Trametes coccinea BRFM310]
ISDEARAQLQSSWCMRKYLVIDEFSMLSKTFFTILLRSIALGLDAADLSKLNLILCGDFHQFPPVAVSPREALYRLPNLERDDADCLLGRKLYKEFTTVVILKEQMRISDAVWHDFLTHLRYGSVRPDHLKMLRSLVVNAESDGNDAVDFGCEPWSDAVLVTPRHAVREAWNAAAVRWWCTKMKRQLFICPAEDTVNRRPLTLKERYALACRNKTQQRRRGKDLPEEVEIAEGMQVMVTTNIETDLDIANGARGEVVKIVLHPDEPPITDEAIVKLRYPPAYILVRLHRTRA